MYPAYCYYLASVAFESSGERFALLYVLIANHQN